MDVPAGGWMYRDEGEWGSEKLGQPDIEGRIDGQRECAV